MTKYALIFENLVRDVIETNDTPFDVAAPMFWKDVTGLSPVIGSPYNPSTDTITSPVLPTIDVENTRSSALLLVDNTAGDIRQRFITSAPGQELTYQEKAEQAADFAAANYPTGQIANYPFIQVEVNVTGLSPQAAADGILSRRTLWIQKGALIEEARLIGKRDINVATDVIGINTALNTALTALNSIS
jgi:hypothetical protein